MHESVECRVHGVQPTTFVCQHIADSLRTGEPVGFYWSRDDVSPRPDAWCSACNDRVERSGGEWVGDAREHLGAKVLCGSCYDDARRQCLGDGA